MCSRDLIEQANSAIDESVNTIGWVDVTVRYYLYQCHFSIIRGSFEYIDLFFLFLRLFLGRLCKVYIINSAVVLSLLFFVDFHQ